MNIVYAAVPAVVASALALTMPSFAQSSHEESREKAVQMSEVPQPARDAAQKQLGTAPTEAKIIPGTSPQEYELEGKNMSGKEVGVHVRADGTVMKTEKMESEHNYK